MSLLNNKFVLCDINYKTGMIDEENLIKCLEKCKKKGIKPNLLMPVHYAGNVLELSKIKKICKRRKIAIIEDGCHSFGSSKNSTAVGSCKYSIMTTFSFHPVKNITTLEGGAITTNSRKIYQRLKAIRSHALLSTTISDPYRLIYPSLNFRMSEINAFIGVEQIKLIRDFRRKRNLLVNYYINKLSFLKDHFEILNIKDKKIFWHLFVIKLKKISLKKN